MDRIDAMRAFVTVADLGGFAPAARALRWSPASVTRAVAQLEEELGVSLFNRTTRVVRLTEGGTIFADKSREILSTLAAARSLTRGEDAAPGGTLRVTAPALFGRRHVMPIAEATQRAHPALTLRITLLDRVVHLVEEGFDVAVRLGPLPDSALVAVKLAEVRLVIVASPAYLAQAGTPRAPGDLAAHRIVSFEGVGSTDEWQFGPRRRAVVRTSPRLAVNCAEAALGAIERGHGIGRLYSYQLGDGIAAGRLVRLLPDDEPPPVPVSLVYAAGARNSANVRAFVSEAVRYCAAHPLA
ncbi:LysR family transcriptional regulator [Qipengyuania sediminis]|uniref:LysR family transcriptional regulator n=1 Tax=Qipengyuania sediminis TaxID=1532023 RepID=UPI0010593EC7|nr:LysR family transcriptional regulator [Qipengyuania sediminis]